MNAHTILTPRNWHDMLAVAQADRENAPYWIGMIRAQAKANGSERELVLACQLYLDVYDDADQAADALGDIAECLADDTEYETERWADEADYRYDLMRDERMVAAWERAA